MTAQVKNKLFSAISVLICIAALLQYVGRFENSEFPSGRVTGILLELYNAGLYMFVTALVLIFIWPRVAAGIELVAAVLCLPLFLNATFPGMIRWIFPGQYKTALTSSFTPDKWTILIVLVIATVSFLNIRSLFPQRGTQRRLA